MTQGSTADAWLLTCGHESPGPATAGSIVDCVPCDHRSVPTQVTIGRKTKTFAAGTVPVGLLRDHRTTAWARLEVEAGSVAFLETESHRSTSIEAGEMVVIVPDRAHRIQVSADARFAIQFFDLPEKSAGEHGGADGGSANADEGADR